MGAAQTGWQSKGQRQHALQAPGGTCDGTGSGIGHITRRELALVAAGSFQVEEDLEVEAAADCKHAKAL